MSEEYIRDDTLFAYKCPCCGGKIEFKSDLQKLQCPYCDTVFDIDDIKNYDDLLNEDAADNIEWQQNNAEWSDEEKKEVFVYNCHSCGGEIICEQTTAATSCPYCGNPVVMAGRLAGDLRPDLVIPFKLNKDDAKKALSEHIKGKKLIPKIYSDQNHIDEIKGVYVPFWLFDAESEVEGRWRATKVRSWTDTRYRYTETKYYEVFRKGNMSFENIPVDGSIKMDNNLMESIEPFDLSEAVDFKTAYLSGYLADRYDVSENDCVPRANERLKYTSENVLDQTVSGYASAVRQSSFINIDNGKAKYVLYPVWLLSTNWNGQRFLFAMNGQTGKFVGNLPVDKKRVFLWFMIYLLSSTAIMSVIVMLIKLFMQM